MGSRVGALLNVIQLIHQRKKITYEGDGYRVEEKGELFLTGMLVNKAIYVDLIGRNEVRPLGGSMKVIGIDLINHFEYQVESLSESVDCHPGAGVDFDYFCLGTLFLLSCLLHPKCGS